MWHLGGRWGQRGHAAGDKVSPGRSFCTQSPCLLSGSPATPWRGLCWLFGAVETPDGDPGVFRATLFRFGMLRARGLETRDGETQGAELWDFGDRGCRRRRMLRAGAAEAPDVRHMGQRRAGVWRDRILETWDIRDPGCGTLGWDMETRDSETRHVRHRTWRAEPQETWDVGYPGWGDQRREEPGCDRRVLSPCCGAGLGVPAAGWTGPRQSHPGALVQSCQSREPGLAQPRGQTRGQTQVLPGGQTRGVGTGFFYRFLFRLILPVPSHLFKALGDGASTKHTIKRGLRVGGRL